jgi:tripeptidyl-peptidase-1
MPTVCRLFLIFSLLCCGVSLTQSRASHIREAPPCILLGNCVSNDWSILGPADSDAHISFTAGLQQSNLSKVQEIAANLSDIYNPMYGQHLSFQQMGDLVRNPEAIEAFETYLKYYNVTSYVSTTNGEFYTVKFVPVAVAEKMLRTKFYNFYSVKTGKTIVRALNYKIARRIRRHVKLFINVCSFPQTNGLFPIVTPYYPPTKTPTTSETPM